MDSALRRARYAKISTELAHHDDDALRVLVGNPAGTPGWGSVRTVEVAGEPVFVKIIPLTELELARPYSTRNHYRLPTCYQYGIGSAGFGAWREIITYLKLSNQVLADAVATFPLAYHVRVVRRAGRASTGPADLERYVRYWNSSRGIERFLTERAGGTHEAMIFLEHLAHPLADWLLEHPEDTPRLIGQLCDTTAFLRDQGIVHFDAHLGNIMTDGDRVYLTDFGLALDGRFSLTAREREFLDRHRLFDLGEILYGFGPQLMRWYRSLPTAEQQQARALVGAAGDDNLAIELGLVRGAERLAGVAHPAVIESVIRYRAIIEFMIDFFITLQKNRRKNTRFGDARLGELLRAAEVPVD
ncbi:hypothetical protein [Microlunatus speluncae]|uniref:hypothetical protein n=1 Tax=Microlunatus speluncae TaxID=2594267 RepID=UPI0012667D7B|nr:hypothetical protein [Microlunatus speluncae]